MRILVVEDDAPLAVFLRKGLESEDYGVDVAADGNIATVMAMQSQYDLVILDLNLPQIDGTRVLDMLREHDKSLPVLVLTARNRVEDRVKVLDLGADDYLIKPFSYHELSARIRAVLRRKSSGGESKLKCHDLEVDRVDRSVARAGKRIDLTSKEYALLEYLLRHNGQPVTRVMIIENVWNLSQETMTNVVDVYINYLRKKVDEGHEVKLIHTIRGVGYSMGTKMPSGREASAHESRAISS
jgi:two-component system copper resistance phosphate regulon response regulator CusR